MKNSGGKMLCDNDDSILEKKITTDFPSQSCGDELNLLKSLDTLDDYMNGMFSCLS